MTNITIDRKFLEEVVELFDSAITARHPHEILRDIRAALAAPAAAPEFPADWAQMIHYPECWDTAAYPELRDAIHEALAWSGCSVCKPATAPDEQVRRDAERVAWYENNPEKVLNIGFRWYSRNGYGLPMKRRKGFREAIDAAMKETP